MYPRTPSSFALYPAALDVVTPPLDGTVLPGVTRAAVLSLFSRHLLPASLPQLPQTLHIHATERPPTMSELFAASASRALREGFCTGTSAVVIPAARIGWQRGGAGGAGGGTAEGRIVVTVQAAGVEYIVFPVAGTSDGPPDLRRRSPNSGSRNTLDPDRVVRMV